MINATLRTTLHPGKRNGTHCIEEWVGPTARLNGCRIPPPPGFSPRIVYPVAKRLYKNVLKNIYLSCLMIMEREEGGGNNEGAVN